MLNGSSEIYYENGKIYSRKNYINRVLNGITESYYQNGKINSKIEYKNNKKMD
jgi:antitoxin component YwqK of YwqJK toxin-antitoxin module